MKSHFSYFVAKQHFHFHPDRGNISNWFMIIVNSFTCISRLEGRQDGLRDPGDISAMSSLPSRPIFNDTIAVWRFPSSLHPSYKSNVREKP